MSDGHIIKCNGKVVCVESLGYYPFTVGNIYEYVGKVFHNGTGTNCYVIKNDSGVLGWYDRSIFITLDKYRENKLNELIDE